jgi:hypothetical protein
MICHTADSQAMKYQGKISAKTLARPSLPVLTAATRTAGGPSTPAATSATLPSGSRRARAPAAWCGSSAAIDPPGRSAVSLASSAQVRAPSARPARASSSSLVSLPCTNAALRKSTTCSRSACEARRWPWPAVDGVSSFPGPGVMGTPPAQYRESVTRLVTSREAPACLPSRAKQRASGTPAAPRRIQPPLSKKVPARDPHGVRSGRPKCDHDGSTDSCSRTEQRS